MAAESESEGLRQLIHEEMLRSDKRWAAMIAEWREERRTVLAEIEAHEKESRRRHEAVMRQLDEQFEESRAQRAALFRILDRLDDGGAAPA